MHEWALAEAVISTAIKAAEEAKIREIAEIKVKLGELQQIDPEIFEFALKEVIPSQLPLLRNTRMELEIEEAILRCGVCGEEWGFREAMKRLDDEQPESIHFVPEIAHVYVKCPKCKSSDFEILKGRGVWIDYIKGKE